MTFVRRFSGPEPHAIYRLVWNPSVTPYSLRWGSTYVLWYWPRVRIPIIALGRKFNRQTALLCAFLPVGLSTEPCITFEDLSTTVPYLEDR